MQEAMIDVIRFGSAWASTGFGWTRCPIFEREGTNCENLPETRFLKRVRRWTTNSPAALLAEANQWPGDVVEYFGDPNTGGDERHMAFHFPLMPRIFHGCAPESCFRSGDHRLRPHQSLTWRNGDIFAQPRFIDVRNGHRRRARLRYAKYAKAIHG